MKTAFGENVQKYAFAEGLFFMLFYRRAVEDARPYAVDITRLERAKLFSQSLLSSKQFFHGFIGIGGEGREVHVRSVDRLQLVVERLRRAELLDAVRKRGTA